MLFRWLHDLLAEVSGRVRSGSLQRQVWGITADSRQLAPGMLFVAVRGDTTDGHRFVEEALAKGAAAVVVEQTTAALLQQAQARDVAVIEVPNSRQALGLLASAFYRHPSRQLALVGVTGTNGKTTTCYVIEAILRAAGRSVGVLGTINYRFGSHCMAAPHTTPEAPTLQHLLAQMVAAGVRYAAMEVSSHALVQERVRGCHFAACVFTNLSRDHYDYHGSEAAYFEAKARLFREYPACWHILNLDDPRGRQLAQATSTRLLTYGLHHAATLTPETLHHDLHGIRGVVPTPIGRLAIRSSLVGRHNVYNLLAGIAVAVALEVEAAAIVEGIAQLRQVPGRLERVEAGQPFAVFVDYAHTPAALEQVLRSLRADTAGRLITVFGCGGDRDPGKRPLMGRVATQLSDYTIVTSDNPRSEDPLQIIAAIVAGIAKDRAYVTIPDRREAIAHALAVARPGDAVLIAGKGHEDYQIVGQQRLPFDDREVVRSLLTARGG
ncbi:MAG: UDP-N-acetylmuramoyl-L-alanyl-D-glutamate--2,6-diaminopimelate ligase [Candidatus Tectimicrobiota bacterium]|nr:MAG: UDP-N-acetylmuramoyl-L-alanyl-D-glutamate--2,6-diaminopimelate ligase [Candidatus Tectomicrobia bacterium]